jgi:hypothetical protein
MNFVDENTNFTGIIISDQASYYLVASNEIIKYVVFSALLYPIIIRFICCTAENNFSILVLIYFYRVLPCRLFYFINKILGLLFFHFLNFFKFFKFYFDSISAYIVAPIVVGAINNTIVMANNTIGPV